MKKTIFLSLLLLITGFASASAVPFDGMTLKYDYSYEFENQQYPSTNRETQKDITVSFSQTSDGYEADMSGFPSLQGTNTVKGSENTAFWLAENVSAGDTIQIAGNEYTITSPSTEININGFGSVNTIEATYEYYSSEYTSGNMTVSDYSETRKRFFHPESGIMLRYEGETSYVDFIRGYGDMDKTETTSLEIRENNANNDGDDLTDLEELIEYNTDPVMEDTDEDGLNDGAEVQEHDTNPRKVDTDGDNLTDEEEINLETDPREADTDSDRLDDGREQELGTSPTEADSDSDGLDDAREVEIGSDPNEADSDQDGLRDGREVEIGTSPTETDTDGDFLNDQTDPMPTNPLLPNGAIALVIIAVGGLAYRRRTEEE